MENAKTPLLTIVIATKNREYYCIEAIKSILSLKSNKIELAVSDNSDSDLIKIFVESLIDIRLKYVYNNSLTSSIGNFNRALALATGEYVCVIGDDDGINPEIIDITNFALCNNLDAISGSMCANYRWEGTDAPNTLFTKMTGSTLTIVPFNGKAEFIDINSALYEFMNNGCTNYADYKLPRLYHGIVKRKILEEIKDETGEYFKGLSPDIYSSLSISNKINRYIFIDYPITIPGVCGASTSITEGQKKITSKKINDIPHLRYRGEYSWSTYVPRFYCVQTIWADSGFAALDEFKRYDLIKKFNRHSLYSKIILADLSLIKYLFKHIYDDCKSCDRNVIAEVFLTLIEYIKGYLSRNLFLRAKNRFLFIIGFKRLLILTEINNMTNAMDALSKLLKNRNINFQNNLSDVLNIQIQ